MKSKLSDKMVSSFVFCLNNEVTALKGDTVVNKEWFESWIRDVKELETKEALYDAYVARITTKA